ncbi:MAG: Mur ligase family protein [Actinomycetota bacterium]|nr:Mur ligase family protein [Actinomycetota bacterium]
MTPVTLALLHETGGVAWAVFAVCILALVPAGARWLRVAQREHYIPDATSRFAIRWWTSDPFNVALVAVALAGVVLSGVWPLAAIATIAVAVFAPLHLSIRGRTSPLVLTRRLRSLAVVWLAAQAALIGVGVGVGAPVPFAAVGLVAAPVLVDAALFVTAPIERRLSQRFVDMAAARLRRVGATIVAITGSYGKTSTKNHVAHLVTGTKAVVATPASFNNRVGLARAVNEHLAEGTEVFVAEMGTYGPGEIRDLCRWCPPQISVMTAIGPVHLERFGSEDAILAAKSEINERASVVVVNSDDPRLAALGAALDAAAGGPEVVRAAAEDSDADVRVEVDDGKVSVVVDGTIAGEPVPLPPGIQPTNLACAIAVALQLDVSLGEVLERVPTLAAVANRLTADTSASGVHVIDDTFNSNPAGARAALALLAAAPSTGERVVVTPGMVELGRRQAAENEAFAAAACEVASTLVVVGLTNRRALLRGAAGHGRVVVVRTRDEAVAWVRTNLGPGEVVLYENDLPDHYP